MEDKKTVEIECPFCEEMDIREVDGLPKDGEDYEFVKCGNCECDYLAGCDNGVYYGDLPVDALSFREERERKERWQREREEEERRMVERAKENKKDKKSYKYNGFIQWK